VLYICGQHNNENVVLADQICTGLQLANFWQDVRRDFEMGRVYLPREDCDRFGYSQESLDRRESNDSFFQLMRFEVDRARDFLQAGLPLVERLPGRLRIDIELFARGGLCVLDRIAGVGYRVWDERPVVGKRDVAALLLGCLVRRAAHLVGLNRAKSVSSQ
jgi:phytoene/squalene synthetase